jgi:hypothetical protein
MSMFETIFGEQDEIIRELDACIARGTRARAQGDDRALFDERRKYRYLREQARTHGELYDCALALSRYVLCCKMYHEQPRYKEIRHEVYEIVWFHAPKLDDDCIELLLDATVEALDE